MLDTEEVKKDVKTVKAVWNTVRIIEGLVLIVIGVLAIVYRNNDNFQAWIYRILGIVLAIDGVIALMRYYFIPGDFSEAVANFASSIVEITFGIFFIFKAEQTLESIKGLLLYFISILCFVNAFVLITGATFGIVKKVRNIVLAVFEYVLAAGFIAGGVLLLVNQDKAEQTLYVVILVIIGLIMIAIGIYDIVSVFIPYAGKERVRKAKVEKIRKDRHHKDDKTVEATEVKPEEENKDPDVKEAVIVEDVHPAIENKEDK